VAASVSAHLHITYAVLYRDLLPLSESKNDHDAGGSRFL
jgi:hypothetical protein